MRRLKITERPQEGLEGYRLRVKSPGLPVRDVKASPVVAKHDDLSVSFAPLK